MEKKTNKTSKKEKVKKTKSNASAKDAERVRQIISIDWKVIDARLNNLRKTCGGDTPLFYQAIIVPLKIRFAKWDSLNIWRAFCPSHKERPNNSRKDNRSKRSTVVSNSKRYKARLGEDRPVVLPKGFGEFR
jgi:hypothetical protein